MTATHRYILKCSTGRVLELVVEYQKDKQPVLTAYGTGGMNEVETAEYDRWSVGVSDHIARSLTPEQIDSTFPKPLDEVVITEISHLPRIKLTEEKGLPKYFICHNISCGGFDCDLQVPEVGDVFIWQGDCLALEDDVYMLLCKRFPVHHGEFFVVPKGWVLETDQPWEAADNPTRYLKKIAQAVMRKLEQGLEPVKETEQSVITQQKWYSTCCGAPPIGEVDVTQRDDDGEVFEAVGFCKDCHDPSNFVTKEKYESEHIHKEI